MDAACSNCVHVCVRGQELLCAQSEGPEGHVQKLSAEGLSVIIMFPTRLAVSFKKQKERATKK
eukprot:scaffold1975_cov54-Attheya_sp.AAC.4